MAKPREAATPGPVPEAPAEGAGPVPARAPDVGAAAWRSIPERREYLAAGGATVQGRRLHPIRHL